VTEVKNRGAEFISRLGKNGSSSSLIELWFLNEYLILLKVAALN